MMHRKLKTEFHRAEDVPELMNERFLGPDTREEIILVSVGHLGGPGNPDGEDGLEFDFDDTNRACGGVIFDAYSSHPYRGDDRDWYTLGIFKLGVAFSIHVLWDSFVEVLRPLKQTIPYGDSDHVPEVED